MHNVAGCEVVTGALVVRPNNTAVLDGQSVELRCQSDGRSSAAISWSRRLVNGTNDTVVTACNLPRQLSGVYRLNDDGRGRCNLVIRSTRPSLTGLYICQDSSGQTASAHVTIIGQLLTYCSHVSNFVCSSRLDLRLNIS